MLQRLKRYRSTLFIWVVMVFSLPMQTQSVTADDEFAMVTAPEVKKMQDTTLNLILVHALSRIEFDQQHIPGSINIPTNDMSETDALPKNKATPLVFYCMGVKCKYSYLSAQEAVKKGYTNVYWFKGGIPEWRKYDYPMAVSEVFTKTKVKKLRTDAILEAIEYENAFILDVRPFWWDGSQNYIYQSVNVPLLELDKFLDILPADRPIIVNDAFMKQSVSAAKFLLQEGFKVKGVMKGGMNRWEKAGMPVVDKSQVRVLNPEKREVTMGGE